MKKLEEMTLEELWRLFPVCLCAYKPEYPVWFEEEKAAVTALAGAQNIFRISHIGSTSVPGLLAKPTVDILLELTPEAEIGSVEASLSSEWRLMSRTEKRSSFNKGYTPQGFAEKVFHLHVQRKGDPDELYFRDFLCEHPEAAAEYAALKEKLQRKYRGGMHTRRQRRILSAGLRRLRGGNLVADICRDRKIGQAGI